MQDGIRVLYVDDEPGLLEIGRIFLEHTEGLHVDTSISAPEALTSAGIRTCDAIVSDYQMPEMNGIAFLKAVRKQYGGLPFILFTGRGREEVVIDAINNGADFYLQKGGDAKAQFAELAHKIRQAVARKKTEHALIESQDRLRSFMDSATDAFTIWDRDLNLIDMNRVATTLLPPEKTKEEILGRNLKEFLSGSDEWGMLDRYREVIRTGIPFTGTGKPVGMQHKNRWMNVRCFRVGEGLGIITRDITRERESEEELREAYEKLTVSDEELRQQFEELAGAQQKILESQEQFAELAHTVPGVVYQFRARPDGTMGFDFVSSRAPDVFGLGSDPAHFFDEFYAHMDPRDRDTILESIKKAVSQELPWDIEGRFIKPSGEKIWFHGFSRPVRKGNLLVYNGVLVDITGRKEAEEALREANRKLSLLNSITRHDIVNQLMILRGITQLASQQERDPVVAGYLSKINGVSERIQHQIEFTKMYQDLGVQSPVWARLDDVVVRAGRKDVRCSPSCTGFEIYADPMLEKVFSNLFDNAVRHGEYVTAIDVGCTEGTGSLSIIVSDNGIGIPAGDKEKIFGKGYGKNTGFGLFLTREILAITGITIRENGEPGNGGRFEIIVPQGKYRAVVK